jgi:uncharacterized protein (TIGR02646 family)
MIRVDRGRVPAPPSLAKGGVEERERAIELYGDPRNSDRSFAYAAYKARDVVQALTDLFHGKCAYCESSYAPVSPVDIEHFRPKGAVAVLDANGTSKRRKPGYYWLAAEWDNLLASCIDCNRARTHEFPDDDVAEVAGKENKFPLIDETRRGSAPGDELTLEADQRLLLHPCRDQPERHLEFLPTGVIRPRSASRKGRETITALALRRSELCEARRAHLLELSRKMRNILWEIEQLERSGPDPITEANLQVLIRELREAADDRTPYAGMARQFIAGFEASMRDGTVKRFVHHLLAAVSTAGPG